MEDVQKQPKQQQEGPQKHAEQQQQHLSRSSPKQEPEPDAGNLPSPAAELLQKERCIPCDMF